MKPALATTIVVLILTSYLTAAEAKKPFPNLAEKKIALTSVDGQSQDLTTMSDEIWRFAETALKETKSSKVLADYAEQKGFKVERGVAGMPTAFIATYGEGRPIIGILGEYDALPGISQKASPVKEALEPGAPGHGCGHNLFGVASLGAAVAVKELIATGKLKGTIRFYGTPAEESVGGKVYMAREGLFKDLDIALAWHPGTDIESDTSGSQAIVDTIVEFKGKAAHAAFDPWNGRSAVDGLEIFTHALNMMREHVKPTVRMHYAIVKGGDVPNVVPEYAKLWLWVRDSKRAGVEPVLERVRKMVEGAALAADVQATFKIQTGDWEMLVNVPGQRVLQSNLEWLGPIQYTNEEQQFAKQIQGATGVEQRGLLGDVKPWQDPPPDPEGGSTDVGDISWNVPVINLVVTTAPDGAPWHAWPVVATGGMSIGHKGMIYAAKALSATMIDLFKDAKQRDLIRADFERNAGGIIYKPYIPDGPPPIPTN
jgi:aminobenzoyl-glutamate utilization protein B